MKERLLKKRSMDKPANKYCSYFSSDFFCCITWESPPTSVSSYGKSGSLMLMDHLLGTTQNAYAQWVPPLECRWWDLGCAGGAAHAPYHEEVCWSCTKYLVSDLGRNLSGITSDIACLPSLYTESSHFLRYLS